MVHQTKLTVKALDGTVSTIVATDHTSIMKGRGNRIKMTDLKVGDGVIANGMLFPDNTLHASIIHAMDASVYAQMRDNMGKTYIIGKVTRIDAGNGQITLTRLDGTSQTIGIDESTSLQRRLPTTARGVNFQKSGATASPAPSAENITLAKIKVGDQIGGPGDMKNGVFVLSTLTVSLLDEGPLDGNPNNFAPNVGFPGGQVGWDTRLAR